MRKFKPGDKAIMVGPSTMKGIIFTVEYAWNRITTGDEFVKLVGALASYPSGWLDVVSEDATYAVSDCADSAAPVVEYVDPPAGIVEVYLNGKLITGVTMDESEEIKIPGPQPFDYPDDDESRERKARAKLVEYKRGMRDLLYGTTSQNTNDGGLI